MERGENRVGSKFFNLIKMKKFIFCFLCLIAFNYVGFANTTIEEKATDVIICEATDEDEDEYCTNISFQICLGDVVITVSGYFCASSEDALYDSVDALSDEC